MKRFLAKLIRTVLDRFGYVLWKREFLLYGISPFLDIVRLGRASGHLVRTVFDVGANIGQTSRLALATFPDARIFAFEPHPDTFKRLTEAITDQRLSAYQIAFGEQDGDVTLYEYASSGSDTLINSLVPDARFATQFGKRAKERVARCSTIDCFCEKYGIERIDVLKIDAEGFDLFVMKGAVRMLRDGRIAFILTEYNDLHLKEGTTGGALFPIAEYLSSFGYHYVTSYTYYVLPEHDMFLCANALFALKNKHDGVLGSLRIGAPR